MHATATMGAYFARTHRVCNSKGITNRVNRRGICLAVIIWKVLKILAHYTGIIGSLTGVGRASPAACLALKCLFRTAGQAPVPLLLPVPPSRALRSALHGLRAAHHTTPATQSQSTTGALPGLPLRSVWRCCSCATRPCSQGMLVSFHTPSIFLQGGSGAGEAATMETQAQPANEHPKRFKTQAQLKTNQHPPKGLCTPLASVLTIDSTPSAPEVQAAQGGQATVGGQRRQAGGCLHVDVEGQVCHLQLRQLRQHLQAEGGAGGGAGIWRQWKRDTRCPDTPTMPPPGA